MTEHASTPASGMSSGISAAVRVLVYAAVLAAVGAGLLFVTPGWTETPDRSWSLPFFALVIAFGVAEAAALHVEIRKESHSLSLACIPLMYGLLYTSPALVLLAYVLGGGATLLWIRHSDLIKVTWNVCLFVTQVGLAGLIVRATLGERLPEESYEWAIPLSAVIAAELLSLIAVPLVIMVVDGKFRPELFRSVGQSQILAVLAGTFAVTAISASLAGPYMALYAVAPLVGLGVLLRSTGHLAQRFRDLQQLHTFTSALANERGARTLDTGLIELVELMRSRSAGLAVVGHDDNDRSLMRVLVDDTFEDLDPDPVAVELIGLLGDQSVAQFDLDDRRPAVRSLLEHLGCRRLLAARVLSEVDTSGVLFVTDRLGMRSTFTVDELRLFGSLANTLSARLSNDHLVGMLENQARTDALTGLPNRLSFEIAVTASISKPGRRGAIVMIDLDRFKEINDSLGHDTGDRLLVEIADRLRSCTAPTDMVSRFGGDEFAVMITALDPEDRSELVRRVDRLLTTLTAKVELEGITFEVGASVGAVEWPGQGAESSTLLHRADTAMYEAKRNQLGVVWYQPKLDADAPRRLDLYMSVSAALDNEEFLVHFQPKVRIGDGEITGAEALVRWNHPAHGPISPNEFVPLIVQAGLVGKLTRLVIRRSIEAAETFRSFGFDVPIAVNLTPRDLLDPRLVTDLEAMIDEADLPAGSLLVEITEDAMVVDFDSSVIALARMRELGLRVAIDDFGTGYSSLQHLHRLPIDQLKIDRSFVSRITVDASAEAIVRASINLANDLLLCTVAEGIEDVATLRELDRLGCVEMQGYLVSPAVPVHDFVRWARNWDPAAFAATLRSDAGEPSRMVP